MQVVVASTKIVCIAKGAMYRDAKRGIDEGRIAKDSVQEHIR